MAVGAPRLDHARAVREVHLEASVGEPEHDVVVARADHAAATTALGAHGAERDVVVAHDRVLVPGALGDVGLGAEVAAVVLGREDPAVVGAVALGEPQAAETVRRRGAHPRIMPALSGCALPRVGATGAGREARGRARHAPPVRCTVSIRMLTTIRPDAPAAPDGRGTPVISERFSGKSPSRRAPVIGIPQGVPCSERWRSGCQQHHTRTSGTSRTRTTCSSGCAARRGRCAGSPAWWRTRRTASTC